jgi:hypothetical protein
MRVVTFVPALRPGGCGHETSGAGLLLEARSEEGRGRPLRSKLRHRASIGSLANRLRIPHGAFELIEPLPITALYGTRRYVSRRWRPAQTVEAACLGARAAALPTPGTGRAFEPGRLRGPGQRKATYDKPRAPNGHQQETGGSSFHVKRGKQHDGSNPREAKAHTELEGPGPLSGRRGGSGRRAAPSKKRTRRVK